MYARIARWGENVSVCGHKRPLWPRLTSAALRYLTGLMANPRCSIAQQGPTHWLVLDFEATCDAPTQLENQEIIEFPVVAVDARTHRTVAQFRTFVRPLHNPKLTNFCTELTGIQQHQVDQGLSLGEALEAFHTWMIDHGFAGNNTATPATGRDGNAAAVATVAECCTVTESRCVDPDGRDAGTEPVTGHAQSISATGTATTGTLTATGATDDERLGASPGDNICSSSGSSPRLPLFVTCGNWDVRHLHAEAASRGLLLQPYWATFCNIKIPFSSSQAPLTGQRRKKRSHAPGMMGMLELLGLPHQGRHHSGIDDVHNIARIAVELSRLGINITATGRINRDGAVEKVH